MMHFTFEKYHGYTILNGLIPFEVALKIDQQCPRNIVRCYGYAGGIDPYELTNALEFYDDDGYELCWKKDKQWYVNALPVDIYKKKFVCDITIGEAFVNCYHIDQESWVLPIIKILEENGLLKPYPEPIKTSPEIKSKLSIARLKHLKEHGV